MLTEFILLAFSFGSVLTVNIGQQCSSSSQCSVPNSECRSASSSCGFAVCSCRQGFLRDGNSCKRGLPLSAACNAAVDKCWTENAACRDGFCGCAPGYKLRGSSCIRNTAVSGFGEQCFDRIMCYNELVCIANQCTCLPSMKLVNGTDCVPRRIDDVCADDDDCAWTPNAVCNNKRCSCGNGFPMREIVDSKGKITKACLKDGDRIVGKGESCNPVSYGDNVSYRYCNRPYFCDACSDEISKCQENEITTPKPATQQPVIASHASSKVSATSVLLSTLAVVLFIGNL